MLDRRPGLTKCRMIGLVRKRSGALGGICEVSAHPAPGIRDDGKDRHGEEAAEVISSDH